MGSCEDLVYIHEPSVSEQHSCSELAHSDEDFISALDMCSDLSDNKNAGIASSSDVIDRCVNSGRMVGDHDDTAVLSLDNLVKNGCGFSGDCLKENQRGCLKEGCSVVASMTGLPMNLVQHDQQNGNGKVLVEVIKDKTDASAHNKSDLCEKVSHLLGAKISTELITRDSQAKLKAVDKQKHNGSSNCITPKVIVDVVEEKDKDLAQKKTDTFEIEILSTLQDNKISSQLVLGDSEKPSKAVTSTHFPGSHFQQDEQNYEINNCILLKAVDEVAEEMPLEGSPLTDYCDHCEPLGTVNDSSTKELYMPPQFQSDVSSSNYSSHALDFSRQMDSEGKDDAIFDIVSKTKCCGTVSLSSQRSSRSNRSNRKTQTKRAARKGRNTPNVSCTCESIDIVFNAVRKKRTCLSKPARISIWGFLGNVAEHFKQSKGHEAIQVQNQGSGRQKSSQKNGKKNKSQAAVGGQGSQRKSRASTSCLRLKVKLGEEVSRSCLNIPEVVDASTLAAATSRDCGTKLCWANNLGSSKLANDIVGGLRKGETAKLLDCFGNYQEKSSYSNHAKDKLAGDVGDNFPGVPCPTEVEAPEELETRNTDPGTSPDSEVINLTPHSHIDFRSNRDFRDRVLTTADDVAASVNLPRSNKAKKKNKISSAENCILGSQIPHMVRKNKAKSSKRHGKNQNTVDSFNLSETLTPPINLNASSNPSDKKETVSSLCLLGETEHFVSFQTFNGESGSEVKILSNPALQNSKDFIPDAKAKGCKIAMGKSKGCDSGNKSDTECKQSEAQKMPGNKKKTEEKAGCDQTTCKLESQLKKGNHITDENGKGCSGEHVGRMDVPNLDVKPGGLMEQHLPPCSAWVCCDYCHKWRRIAAEFADFIEETKCSWVCKDNMNKAFANCATPQEKSNADINAELEISDASGEEDASGPQQNQKGLEYKRSTVPKQSVIRISTNQFLHRSRKNQTIDEIMVCHCKPRSDGRLGCADDCLNRMLNIECAQKACPCGDLCSNQQFQKRRYAKLEQFHCGKKGYGLKSLEDISQGHFLIEYVGEVLDMHAYELRLKEYAWKGHKHFYFMTLNASEVIDACTKGNLGRFINHSCDPNCRTEKWMVNGEICIGLFALRDIKKGEEVTFDYNFVRVFGAAAKKCYCGSPRCRGYIGGDPLNTEVIVQSDSDEEYPEPVLLPEDGKTGDLNFRPRTSSSDSAVMHTAKSVLENRDEKDKSTTADGQLGITTEKVDPINQYMSAASVVQKTSELEDLGKFQSVQHSESFRQVEDVTPTCMSALQQDISVEKGTREKTSSSFHRPEITSPSKTLSASSDGIDVNKKSKSDVADKRVSSKAHPSVKTSHKSSSIKKKVKIKPLYPIKVGLAANGASGLPIKSKKLVESSLGQFEAVEEKLNELLDAEGGISKRNDATKGYLKLLILTAKSGESSNGGTIQSNRDLSMILDALLKTKSRMVLTDIINKNGLRMLHIVMKQYQSDFKKRPILRKLLKVLEYLATREILTLEHINGGPPCPGMESFGDSMLFLTDHEDKQVHQIARNFRDRWIPKSLRRFSFLDRDDVKTEFHRSSNCNRFSSMSNNWHDRGGRPMEAIDCIQQPMPGTTLGDVGIQEGFSAPDVSGCSTGGTKTRKRKSRWDQPAETNSNSITLQNKEQNLGSEYLKHFKSSPLPGIPEVSVNYLDKGSREYKNCVRDHCLHEANVDRDGRQKIHADVPPGFSSPLQPSLISSVTKSTNCHSNCHFDMVIGHPQEKFVSRLPVSYGIPMSIMQQHSTPKDGTSGSWAVAPSMPFYPYPPLPALPRDKREC